MGGVGNGENPVLGIGGHAPLPSSILREKQVEEGIEGKVFRSAWIPAPPPESLPAIVSAIGRLSKLMNVQGDVARDP